MSKAASPSMYQTCIQKIFGFNGIKFPRRMPSDSILRLVARPPSPSKLARMKPGTKNELRLACQMAGLDPVTHLGLNPEPPVSHFVDQLPDMFFQPKGYDRELRASDRKKKIEENMATMEERISKWKDEKKKAKTSGKPELPF